MSRNWKFIEGNWMEFKGIVKEQWGKLTDDELETMAGKKEKLLGILQKRYGYTTHEAEMQVDKFVQQIDTKRFDSHAST